MGLMFGEDSAPLQNVKKDLEAASLGDGGAPVPEDTPQSDPTKELPQTQNDVLQNFPIVANPAMDRNAFDVDQFPFTSRGLQGFMEGHRISVIYYNQCTVQGDVRTDVNDSPNERSAIHTAYRRIDQCEITLKEALSFTYDTQRAQGNATSTALVYAGMTPQYGDIFLYDVGDGKLGMFKITSITPQSWYNDRVYLIGFYFFNYADSGDLSFLESCTVRRSVFDKAAFLDGTHALLTEDKYLYLQQMRSIRDILCKFYFRTFYADYMGSFINPETQIYDPYLVKYMAQASPFDVVHARPRQLLGYVDETYDFTIWSRLSDSLNPFITDVYSQCLISTAVNYSMDIGVTELIGKRYVTVLSPDSKDVENNLTMTYMLSDAFYRGDYLNMSDLEKLLSDSIKTRKLANAGYFITEFLSQYLKLSKSDQFYQIPLYIALIDIAIPTLERRLPS